MSGNGGTDEVARARIDGMTENLTELKALARVTHETVIGMRAALGEQDLPSKIAKLSAEMQTQHSQLRSDLVNAITRQDEKHGKKFEDLDDRLRELEDDKERRTGGLMVFRVLKDYGAWIAAAGAALLAWIRTGGHVPTP